MNKIKNILFYLTFICVISITAISSSASPDVPNISSNTSGNIANGGHVLKYDGWVYYSFDSSGLYRMKEDGSQKTKLYNGDFDNLTEYKGYIYGNRLYGGLFSKGGLFRMKPDGTETVRISDQAMGYITIYDGWVYYTLLTDHYKPHKMKLDGTDDRRLNDYPMSYMVVAEEWIYFESHIGGGDIYKMKHDGSQVTQVVNDANSSIYLNLVGDWLYFHGIYTLSKAKVDGSCYTEICDNVANDINVKDGWIYFSDLWEGIYRIRTDGTEKQRILKEQRKIGNINLTDEWIYYEVFDGNLETTFVYRMRFDGSNNQKFKIGEDYIPDEVPYVKIRIDKKYNTYRDVPININGRILLPFREVLENLGIPDDDEHIIWDGKNKTVIIKKDDTSIFLTIGEKTALVNGEKCELDVAPLIYKQRTYIPARFIAQSLNKKVLWDGENYIVSICEQSEFGKVKSILEATNSAMMNNLQKYSTVAHINLKSEDNSSFYQSELTARAEIDSKERLCNFNCEEKINSYRDLESTYDYNWDEILSIQRWYQSDRCYEKNNEYDAWIETEVTETRRSDFEKVVFSNYSFITADDGVCASFTLDETEDHYILKGDYIFKDLINTALFQLFAINEKIISAETELLIDKKEYYIEKINVTINGNIYKDQDFEIKISLENADFNSTTPIQAPEDFNPDELINYQALELVKYVCYNYLHYYEIDNFEEKTREFILMKNLSSDSAKQYIEAIKAENDIFTFCADEKDIAYGYEGKLIETKDLEKNAVYMKVKYFTDNVLEKFIKEVDKIEEPHEKTLVIDLRDNRGGDTSSIDGILDYLLPECVTSYLINRDGFVLSHKSDEDCVEFKKILVFVNENTQGSAELLALGLKKHANNTTIIGSSTHGKGVGQYVYRNGKERFVVYIEGYYWNVNEQNISDSCVIPDIIVTNDADYMKEVEKLIP